MLKAIAWSVALALPALAQFGTKQTQFRNAVQSWSGHIDFHGLDSGTVTGPAGATIKYTIDQEVSGDVNLNTYNSLTGAWTGSLSNGKITVSENAIDTVAGCTVTNVVSATANGTQDALGKPLIFNLSFDTHSDTWSFWPSSEYVTGTNKATTACGAAPPDTNTTTKQIRYMPINTQMGIPFPDKGFDLVGTAKTTCGCGTVTTGNVAYAFTYNLKAVVKQLELSVAPEGYDTWRPQAGRTEATPGNTISIKATLRYTDGSALPSTTGLTKISFQLMQVSHQPGVAMNFPIRDAQATADLQFGADGNANLIITGAEKNQADTRPGTQLLTTATAVVTAFDWGAWGQIRVTGTMPDGSSIVGHLADDTSQEDVRLPKRQADSYIADSWKTDKGVTGKPDMDDSETEPAGLPDCQGDGLTLYEEYRGFYQNGEHIEGNPGKKDFFIRNLVGAEAEPGIWLFTDITGLEVHKDLTDTEFIADQRVINGNYDTETPHRIEQHGVRIVTCASQSGGATRGTPESQGLRLRPGLVSGICMQDRFQEDRTLTKPFETSVLDQASAYDRAVAHEFLHSVGVEHHGDGDGAIRLLIHGPNDPTQSSSEPYISSGGQMVTVLDENTLEDLAIPWYHEADGAYQQGVAALQSSGESDEAVQIQTNMLQRQLFSKVLQLGRPNGEHSGDVGCVMRYWIAQIYPQEGQDAGDEMIFYAVPPGTEPAGFGICSAGAGTGINAPRSPQPRYFDAAQDRGACQFWVCVNDAVPPGPL